MPPSKIRFVTACQQVLALGAVLAVLTPAANVISLDVVHDQREQGFVTQLTSHRADRDGDRCAARHPGHRVTRADRADRARGVERPRARC